MILPLVTSDLFHHLEPYAVPVEAYRPLLGPLPNQERASKLAGGAPAATDGMLHHRLPEIVLTLLRTQVAVTRAEGTCRPFRSGSASPC